MGSRLDANPAMDTDDENTEPSQPVKKHTTTKSKSSSVSKKKNKKKSSNRRGLTNKLWNSFRRSDDDMDTTDGEHATIKEVVKDTVDDSDHSTVTGGSSSANTSTANAVFQKPRPEKKKSKSKRKRVTIIVEDASDSEYEDEDYNSPWRNRRPSPGQWMEPVESYDQ